MTSMCFTPQQGAFSDEKEDSLRATLAKLESIDSDAALTTLSVEDITSIRRQLSESQAMIRDYVDRTRQEQEEKEMILRRKEEADERLATLEAEYEELLGQPSVLLLVDSFVMFDILPETIQRKLFTTRKQTPTSARWSLTSRFVTFVVSISNAKSGASTMLIG